MKPTHLPKDPVIRGQLIKKLQQKLATLVTATPPAPVDSSQLVYVQTNLQQQKQKQQQILKLRIKLIGDCTELSVTRIQHLEQIFKHYCTHIFKIGKHMTFERLEYEKVHLTLDRLCVLLKDFGLTAATIEKIEYEIIEKKEIVRNFKRLSSNCRDLSFQEFIACLEKLAIVYYDEKELYLEKCERNRQEREARIFQYRKKMKQKKKQEEERKKARDALNKPQGDENQNHEEQEKQENQNQNDNNNEENDDLVEKMMQDDKIENINDQIEKAAQGEGEDEAQIQNQFESQVKNAQKNRKGANKKQIQPQYVLTVQQKIEYFYQLIGVDNVHDFRKKMSQLGLPLFKQYQTSGKQAHHKRSSSTKSSNQLVNVIIQTNQKQDQRRLIQLREKLNIKKQRDKHMYSPVISKEQYEERKKKRQEKKSELMKQMNMSKIEPDTATNMKEREKKKIEIMDKQLSLDQLNHISFDQLKLKFDPKKYVHVDQTDQLYLKQIGVEIELPNTYPIRKPVKSTLSKPEIRDRTATTLRKRTSSNIVEDFKKRAYEIQVKEFHKEAELSKFVSQMKKKQKFRKQII